MAKVKNSETTGLAVKKPAKRKASGKPFKPGQSGNPKGRPLGSRDRRTVIMDAIKRIATEKGMTSEELEDLIQAAGINKAIKGSFFHYQEISNGLYGKITDKVDVTSGGKTLADLVAAASRNGTKKAKPN